MMGRKNLDQLSWISNFDAINTQFMRNVFFGFEFSKLF